MNRRKSVALGSGPSFSSQEKKSRTGFSFRRTDSSRDMHTPLPSTLPGRDTPSVTGDSTTTSPPPVSLRETPVSEEPTGIMPIQEVVENPVATNGTAANHADGQHAQTTTTQVRALIKLQARIANVLFGSLKSTRKVTLRSRRLLMRLQEPKGKPRGKLFFHYRLD